MSYQNLSAFYDVLTDDQPYHNWLYIVQHFTSDLAVHRILDIGCGTGTLTCQLTSITPDVWGMDLSGEMIQLAKHKAQNVTWIQGDMTDFNAETTFDVITIFCDSLNYITSEEDIMATFNHVYHHLNNKGVFMFDVHTIHKIQTQFCNQLYMDDREDLTLIWQTTPGELPFSVWHDLTFFSKNTSGTYDRLDESQFQRTLEKAQYETMLEIIGFKNIQTFYDFDTQNQNKDSDRLFFVATK
ncbi:class I SAM-dependent DNA methyltransferase [Staphylococcus ratti]|uniref:Class I SAM-dependent methyltransferase n=1 Tax=Staphylococcus ratti TaxID=2892440 RepID=A0ABY3PFF9_9STAP|nr:class I SAM-dependent methyltransferase [Staphylococcus ratti]UEX91067.1 class I SAM-dependent methyltransferase [Staphylococcus ratti]